jgi:hypothetical protein
MTTPQAVTRIEPRASREAAIFRPETAPPEGVATCSHHNYMVLSVNGRIIFPELRLRKNLVYT